MSKQSKIRLASWSEVDEILQLHARSMRQLAADFYEPEAIEAFIRFGTLDMSLIGDSSYFVIERGGHLVATGGWSSRKPRYEARAVDESRPLPWAPQATVRSLFVDPDATREGLASSLMAHIENEIVNAGFREGHLTATLSGIPLYRRLGWRSHEGVTIILAGDTKLVGLRMTKQLALPSHVAA